MRHVLVCTMVPVQNLACQTCDWVKHTATVFVFFWCVCAKERTLRSAVAIRAAKSKTCYCVCSTRTVTSSAKVALVTEVHDPVLS